MRKRRDKNIKKVSFERKLRGKQIALEILAVCVILAAVALAVAYAKQPLPPEPTSTAAANAAASTALPQPSTERVTATDPPARSPEPDVSGLAGKKLIALTFDDGPHATCTPRLLDFLKEQEVHATFFVIGLHMEGIPNVVRRAAAEGHQVANHTYRHKDLTRLSPERRRDEIDSCAKLIESLTGYLPTALRPPMGAQDANVQNSSEVPLLLWSVDPRDWSVRNADKVYQHVMDRVEDGDIILLHDIYSESIDAAEKIIPALKAQGYTFVTVDQLFAVRGGAQPGDVVRNRPR